MQRIRIDSFHKLNYLQADPSIFLPKNILFSEPFPSFFLHSPNAGQRIMKIIDLKDDLIQLFTTSHHGYFAFITKSRRVSLMLIFL